MWAESFGCGLSLSLPVFGESRVGSFQRRCVCCSHPTSLRSATLHPKSGMPDFGTKRVEFGNSRIRLDAEVEESTCPCAAD
jgi:hypothetical protein